MLPADSPSVRLALVEKAAADLKDDVAALDAKVDRLTEKLDAIRRGSNATLAAISVAAVALSANAVLLGVG